MSNFWKTLKKNGLFQLCRKTYKFLENEIPPIKRILNFTKKILFSLSKNKNVSTKIWTHEKMAPEIRSRHFRIPNHRHTPKIVNIQDKNDYALPHTKSARHGRKQEKENKTQTNEMNNFLSNNFFDGNKKPMWHHNLQFCSLVCNFPTEIWSVQTEHAVSAINYFLLSNSFLYNYSLDFFHQCLYRQLLALEGRSKQHSRDFQCPK